MTGEGFFLPQKTLPLWQITEYLQALNYPAGKRVGGHWKLQKLPPAEYHISCPSCHAVEYQENVYTQQEKVEQTNFVFNLTGGNTYLRLEEQKEKNIICLYIFHSHNCQLGIHSLSSSCTSSTYSSSSSSSTSLPSIVVVHTILFHLSCLIQFHFVLSSGLGGWDDWLAYYYRR